MYFYCTTKIKNYYKVGIADSLTRVKKRLTTYRSANPKTKIKFFSEIGGHHNGQEIEYSYKNKFRRFRIGRSECYKLNFEILYRHFLKFQHKFKRLHHFWSGYNYFLSDYYFSKEVPNDVDYELSDRDLREGNYGYFNRFIPIASMYDDNKNKGPDKKGYYKFGAKILDIKNADLKEYKNLYLNHLDEKWFGKNAGIGNQEMEKFFNKHFKIKKTFKCPNIFQIQQPVGEVIFNSFDKNYKNLTKKYPKDEPGTYYWEKPEQKSILRQKSVRMMKRVMNRYNEKYNTREALRGIASVLPSSDPLIYLQTLQRIILGNDFKAPKELRKALENINHEIENLIRQYSKREIVEEELNKQLKSEDYRARKNIIKLKFRNK